MIAMENTEICNATKDQIDKQIQQILDDNILARINFAVQETLGGPDKEEIVEQTYNAIQNRCQLNGAMRN